MRVKEIAVQGFKSFANRHRFVFPTGITAIVGPNGSGKSNVADAIRWVLGEQRSSNIRAKTTEDIIFAGTEKRARSGMAQVSVTFDNEDGWLDLDFPEVTITRRAQRDGHSQLLINNAVVRLRDVIDLLGSRLGQGNYTVIGQGMVDSALALRPEDRRALVDEAAGLVPLQRKRDRSLRQLAETDENLTRVRDILEETGPRLRRLARLAERAARHKDVADALREQLEAWYGHHWYAARGARDEAHGRVQSLRSEVDRARAALDGAIARRRSQEEALTRLEGEIAEQRAARERVLREDAEARQAAAVGQVRLESLEARQVELEAAVRSQQTRAAELERLVETRKESLHAQGEEAGQLMEAAQEARARLVEAEAEREKRSHAIETARAEALRQRAQREARRSRIRSIEESIQSRQASRDQAATAIANADQQVEALASAREEARLEAARLEAQLEAAGKALAEAEAARSLRETELTQARDALAAASRALEQLRARADALDALFGELDEVRHVVAQLRSAETESLEILGTVAQLLDFPEDWEAAVAAALGPAVQGIVLASEAQLDAALTLARRSARGQLVLLDLQSALALDLPAAPEQGALAATALLQSPDAEGLVAALLGDTLFVEDLPAARLALRQHPAFGRAATRDGLLLLQGGMVSTGSPARRILEIERERRALPEAISAASDQVKTAREAQESAIAARASAQEQISVLNRSRVASAARRDEGARQLEMAQSGFERAKRERDWAGERQEALDAEILRLRSSLDAERRHLDEGEPEQARLEAEIESASSELGATDLGELRERVSEAAARASAASQARAGQQAMLDAAERDLAAARAAVQDAQKRQAQVGNELEQLNAEVGRLAGAAGSQTSELSRLDAAIAPLELAIGEHRGLLREIGGEVEVARQALSASEAKLSEARIFATRAEDRLERLFDQLRGDAEWLLIELPEQLELGASLEIPLARIDVLPEDTEDALGRLRRQMRAIGAIDQEALAAYSETAERHEMLTEQEQDLVTAERDLRQLLETLENQMRERFDETFGAVAGAFSEFFPMLFGGGEAELVLDGEDSTSAGLEIMARPPGKRRQTLSLLSGGERALTAVALIFALLQVSQTPFVVLDEVDAALDEANVDRFCTALHRLAEAIQVVVITHNRGTIGTAGTVYGVTMAEDGASQIISLRVDAAD